MVPDTVILGGQKQTPKPVFTIEVAWAPYIVFLSVGQANPSEPEAATSQTSRNSSGSFSILGPWNKTFWKTQCPILELLASRQARHSFLFWCEVQGLQSLAQLCGADIPDILWESGGREPPLKAHQLEVNRKWPKGSG